MDSNEALSHTASPQALAAWAHAGQVRLTATGEQSYIEHPRRVVGLLRAGGVEDADVLAAGWLHDVVEDQAVRVAGLAMNGFVDKSENPLVSRQAAAGVIEESFGPRVAAVVVEVSNPLDPAVGYLDHLRRLVAEGSPAALSVKICDHLDNTADLDPAPGDLRSAARLAGWRAKYAAVRPLLRGARSLLDPRWQAEALAAKL